MNSFFRSLKNALLSVAAVAAITFTGMASAQVAATTTPCTGCLPPAPTVPAMGITVEGWTQSGAVGIGETTGFGKVVTGEVVTMTDEKFTLGAETFLTGNANPDCNIDCRNSQSKLSITGTSMVGAASVGYAKNDGTATGCGTTACPPTAASISSTGTNAMFKSSLMQKWVGTPAPATAP